jgi:glucokinase
MTPHYLGIEIGGTKLQLGVGADDGKLLALWRGSVDVAAGPEGIRRQILAAFPEVLGRAGLAREQLRGVGVGFGGPIDDATRTVIKSHQIAGWDGFPLADWVSDMLGLPAVLGNDADVAGLAEALHGAGKGLSPIFYITIGSGIGGGFVIDGEIYRGVGRGAAEIGHTIVNYNIDTSERMGREELEGLASGWGIANRIRDELEEDRWQYARRSGLSKLPPEELTAAHVAEGDRKGDALAHFVMEETRVALAQAILQVIVLLCPRRIIIGGGVSLIGEAQLFRPLREMVAQRVFPPFAGLTDIVPAALGEEVVVHGAIALARKKLANPTKR